MNRKELLRTSQRPNSSAVRKSIRDDHSPSTAHPANQYPRLDYGNGASPAPGNKFDHHRANPKHSLFFLLSMAVTLLLLVIVIFGRQANRSAARAPNADLVLQLPMSTMSIDRGREEGQSAVPPESLEAYREGQFRDAATAWENYLEQYPQDQQMRLFYGHALAQFDPAQAVVELDKLITDVNARMNYRDHAQYISLWAWLQQDEIGRAEALFEAMQRTRNPYVAKARELMEYYRQYRRD